jgi:hypothetical protein
MLTQRIRRACLPIALLAGMAALGGCYYDPYTGTYYPAGYSGYYGYPYYGYYGYPAVYAGPTVAVGFGGGWGWHGGYWHGGGWGWHH